MTRVSYVGLDPWEEGSKGHIDQLGDLFCCTLASADDWTDSHRALVYLFQEIHLLRTRWLCCREQEVLFGNCVYDISVMYGYHIVVESPHMCAHCKNRVAEKLLVVNRHWQILDFSINYV